LRIPLAAAALLTALAARGGAFVDPLDAAADRSAIAARRLLNGAARAGARLVAVGQRGHVVLSDDIGRTWTQAAVPVATDLTAVHFPTAELGWAVGHDGVVLASADGGRTWARQLDARGLGAHGAEASFLDVWFDDARSGFAVGAFDLVASTDDGGRTWTRWRGRTENPRGLHLYAIRRVGGDLWAAGEAGLVLKLDPAAGRFRAIRAPYAGSFFGLTGCGGTVVVFGLRGTALASADGGATWRRAETGVEAALTAGTALPDGRVVLATDAGQVLVSGDGGKTFRRAAIARAVPASALAPAAEGAILVAGAAGVAVQPIRE
jgi:photosystem II stability/assembly factor-like uncharacterized protein